jgi:hypothetical protein
MNLLWRAAFVVGGIVVGSTALNYFVLGNSDDYVWKNDRIGAWREGQVRPACYRAIEIASRDPLAPKPPAGPHRIDLLDASRAAEMTAALNCYLVTQGNAVCERNNRAYIVNYIRKYFDKQREMMDTAAPYGIDEIRNVRLFWDSERNRAITAALTDHVRSGRLVKADFGSSIPHPLRPLFEQHAKATDACAGAPVWSPRKV